MFEGDMLLPNLVNNPEFQGTDLLSLENNHKGKDLLSLENQVEPTETTVENVDTEGSDDQLLSLY